MEICIFNPLDDINPDGTATVWWMRNGSDLNKEFQCSCIYKMLTSVQMFSVFMDTGNVDVHQSTFYKYCRESNKPVNLRKAGDEKTSTGSIPGDEETFNDGAGW